MMSSQSVDFVAIALNFDPCHPRWLFWSLEQESAVSLVFMPSSAKQVQILNNLFQVLGVEAIWSKNVVTEGRRTRSLEPPFQMFLDVYIWSISLMLIPVTLTSPIFLQAESKKADWAASEGVTTSIVFNFFNFEKHLFLYTYMYNECAAVHWATKKTNKSMPCMPTL